MMKVIGFVGSPRKDGNTSTIVNEVLKGAKTKGAEIKTYYLNEMNIKPCQSCYFCRNNPVCCIKDDMQQIYVDIKESEALVIGSPIYMFQISAQTKIFLDRLFAIMSNDYKGKLGEKKAVMVYTQETSEADFYNEYIQHNNNAFRELLSIDVVDTIILGGTVHAEDASKNKDMMGKALSCGQSLVK